MEEYEISKIAQIIGADTSNISDSRSIVKALLTDSRMLSFPETTLFFALKTKSGDGHRYINELYNMRVRNFVVTEIPDGAENMPEANFLVVGDSLAALQKLAAWHRKRFSIPVAGITGSNGKTVAKEFLYQLLRKDFNITRSPRSYNSQIGVPLSVWEINSNNTLAIFEAGISLKGEMEKIEKVIKPTIGIFTGLGTAHQENFGSIKEKCLEKLKLFKDCETVIYSPDNETVKECMAETSLSGKGFTWSRKDRNADIYINSESIDGDSATIIYTVRGKTPDRITIPFSDSASVEDAICCIAAICRLSPGILEDKDRFMHMEPVAMRLEVIEGINGCLIINDSYNSDFTSLSIALDFQQSRKKNKEYSSVIILSDILQSGEQPDSLYRKVADLIKLKKTDKAICIGPELYARRRMFETMPGTEFYYGTDDFLNSFNPSDFENCLILVKGSRNFHFERITEKLERKVHETILEVNLDAIVHNLNYFRSLIKPQTRIVCMVKASAYGAGSHEIAKTLQEHHCDYLAVAVADEGVELRKEGITTPIMVMNPEFGSFNVMFEYNLEPEVYCFRLLSALIKEAEHRGITSYPIHIKVDTGMHRLGFGHDEMEKVCEMLKGQNALSVRSVFSHLAGSDSPVHDGFTRMQAERFKYAAYALENGLGHPVIKHILNSAGIERFPEYQFDMVRLGIGLYGIDPCETDAAGNGLRSISTLKTTILQIRDVPAGDSIGYGRKSYVDRDSRIAVIPIGYADGLDRHLSNRKGHVLVNGTKCPIIGNICMDACMIDVTGAKANEGDTVILFGEGLGVPELADGLGTIPYEILTSVSPRVKKIYYKE